MIRVLLQLVFLPVFIPIRLLYGNILAMNSATILYTWYRNRQEFEEISRTCEEDPENSKTWEQWRIGAEQFRADCLKRGQPFVKVIVKPKPLLRWLNEQSLANNSDNRALYAEAVYKEACEAGIQPGKASASSRKKKELLVLDYIE
ncbi:hypothetical protein [Endozoicomonas atrinae]|uniref:hypothetical protein n=1 Tax=Endozoicomonas atrinae TaxID=1333660 RepID=UPI003B00A8AC